MKARTLTAQEGPMPSHLPYGAAVVLSAVLALAVQLRAAAQVVPPAPDPAARNEEKITEILKRIEDLRKEVENLRGDSPRVALEKAAPADVHPTSSAAPDVPVT